MPDLLKNNLPFQVMVTGLSFKKALIRDHGDEDYLTSSKFAKASFTGAVTNPSKVNLNEDGAYAVTIGGTLTLHGISKKVTVPATIRVAGKKVSADSKFNVQPADYNISLPDTAAGPAANNIVVTIGCLYEPLKK